VRPRDNQRLSLIRIRNRFSSHPKQACLRTSCPLDPRWVLDSIHRRQLDEWGEDSGLGLDMPKLGDIGEGSSTRLPVRRLPWLTNACPFVAGGVYLLAGDPGVGKTTIALQIALDLASQRNKVLYLANEQSPGDLKTTTNRVREGLKLSAAESAVADDYIEVEPLARLEDLEIWRDHVFLPDGRYADLKCLVVDSVQGGGLSPTARKGYLVLDRFTNAAKHHKVTSILIAHVTKTGTIAGPKDLEHQVDVVLHFKKAFKLRPLFVPKNRFGPAILDPIPLMMGPGGLYAPPHSKPVGTTITAVDFSGPMRVGVQARVQLPKYGEKPGLSAPYLPKEKLGLLLDCLSALPDVDASELTYQIACYLPGSNAYDSGLDLAVVMAILASYLQRDVPEGTGFYGEVDLHGNIISPVAGTEGKLPQATNLSDTQDAEEVSETREFLDQVHTLKRVVVPPNAFKGLTKWNGLVRPGFELAPAASVQEAVTMTWPDLK
jgi:DNA repair protein RadA/Sms